MVEEQQERDIWKSFCTAVGAEYREHKEIKGSSGLTHAVQAIAVDDKAKRLILVSAEYNPRIAALMRVDVQATLPDVRVLVARPLAVDLAHTARKLFSTPDGKLDMSRATQLGVILAMGDAAEQSLKEAFGPSIAPLMHAISRSKLPILSHVLSGIEQASSINWPTLIADKPDGIMGVVEFFLNEFRAIDNLAEDRQQGICPIPTYELTDEEWEMFLSGKNIDHVQERLRTMGVYQYFFPPRDNVALGLIDRGFNTVDLVERGVSIASQQGHLISPNTIVPDAVEIPDLVDELRKRGLTVDAQFESEELTEDGRTIRKTLKVKPAEGLIEKLSKIISVKVDMSLKDLLGPR